MKSSSMTGLHPSVTEMTRGQRMRRHAVEVLIGGVIGAGFGFGIASFVDATGFERWTIAELASLGIAFMLFFMGGFVLVMSASEDRWRRLVAFRQPGSEPPDRDSMLAIRRQGVIIALTGPILAAPPVLAHLGLGDNGRAIGAAAVLAVLAFQTWLNWRLYRTSDELVRQVTVMAGAVCFWGGAAGAVRVGHAGEARAGGGGRQLDADHTGDGGVSGRIDLDRFPPGAGPALNVTVGKARGAPSRSGQTRIGIST